MTYLLTWQGTLLALGDRPGDFVQRAVDAPEGAEPVRLDLAWDQLRGDVDQILGRTDAPVATVLRDGPLAGFTLQVEAGRRTVQLSRGGCWLCSAPGGAVTVDRDQGGDWERLLPLSAADLAQVRHVVGSAWLLRGVLHAPPGNRVGAGFMLHLGDAAFDLRYQAPFDLGGPAMRLMLLRDGWRIDPAIQFRPLVYFCVLRDRLLLEQLWLSLRSLLRFGRYTGQVHVLTDCSRAEILAQVPELVPSQLSVQRVPPTDRVGAVAAKYAILDWPGALDFQPVLFADPDTVFDRDIGPMLMAVAAAGQICAPVEPFSPRRSAASAGAALLAADGADPHDALGFNSGTLGIPNLRDHGHVLRLIRRIIANRASLLGRGHFTWVDQPIANYVAACTGSVDTTLLSGFVRYGYPGVVAGQGTPRGLVHVWPPRQAAAKLAAMRAYLDTLQALA